MTKRIKTVFNNQQLCHVWAQQTQEHGKSQNMFFAGTEIYSYGYHYLAAKFYEVKGQKIVLTNSYNYSNTTSKHNNCVSSALYGLDLETFDVPNPSELNCEENINYMVAIVTNYIQEIFSTNKVVNVDGIFRPLKRLNEVLKTTNQYLSLVNEKPIKLDQDLLEALEYHLNERMKAYVRNNTPEQRAIKEAKRVKEAARKAEKLQQSLQEDIQSWKAGIFASLSSLSKLPFELLRISVGGHEVQTTRGASVPLKDAVKALKAFKSGQLDSSLEIGPFTFSRAYQADQETVIVIGCHKILLSEAEAVLAPYMEQNQALQLVQ